MSKLLLDTHSWIWITNGDKNLRNASTLKLIEECSNSASLFIASISIWETAMLESKGRIRFPHSCLEWIQGATGMPGLTVVEISPIVAVEASRLPGHFHGDPADRIIVATARTEGMTLITQDAKILDYARAGYVKAKALF